MGYSVCNRSYNANIGHISLYIFIYLSVFYQRKDRQLKTAHHIFSLLN